MTTVSATTARANLYDLIDEVSTSGKRVGITKLGVTKAVLVSTEELEAWETTMDVMSDPELVKAIREGEKDIKAGRFITLEDMEKELGLGNNIDNVPNHSLKQSKKRS